MLKAIRISNIKKYNVSIWDKGIECQAPSKNLEGASSSVLNIERRNIRLINFLRNWQKLVMDSNEE